MTYDPFLLDPEPAPAAQRRSDGTWACVRADYLAGASAPQLAERYGVSVSAIRTRAREQGWRRADLPDPEPPPADDPEDLATAGDASPAELRTLAWARAATAVRRGRLNEALGWTRLVRQLDALAEKAAAAPALQARAADSLARAADTLASLRRDRPRPTATVEVDDLHDLHEVHAPSEPAAPPSPAHPRACGDPDSFHPAEAVVERSNLGPRMRGDERRGEAMHDLHAAAPPPPHPPTGPALPLVPPAWVRRSLGMR